MYKPRPKQREIGCGMVRAYGIISFESTRNDGKGPYVAEVRGTYGRSASVMCDTQKETLAIAQWLAKRLNK